MIKKQQQKTSGWVAVAAVLCFLYVSLDVSAAMVVMVAVHVLHGDPAPHANHKGLDLALVGATSNAEEAVLAPVLPPGVGGDLQGRGWDGGGWRRGNRESVRIKD